MEDYENKVANSYATLFQNTSKFASATLISRIEFSQESPEKPKVVKGWPFISLRGLIGLVGLMSLMVSIVL